jgi:hypothetical protein
MERPKLPVDILQMKKYKANKKFGTKVDNMLKPKKLKGARLSAQLIEDQMRGLMSFGTIDFSRLYDYTLTTTAVMGESSVRDLYENRVKKLLKGIEERTVEN